MNYPERYEFKYMVIYFVEAKPKTAVYRVVSQNGDYLGYIKWWGAWNQYSFFPAEDIVLSRGCMKDLNSVMDDLMERRKKKSG